MTFESYKAENTDEIVWLRLRRLTSVNLCEKLIQSKIDRSGKLIKPEIVLAKAKGLSSAIESAIGYWEFNSKSLNSRILSKYYFMLQLTIAEQVSSIKNNDDLNSIQKHTEQGHGLGTIRDFSKNFPNDFFAFALTNGHFYSYAKALGLNPIDFSYDKRPRKIEEISDVNKLVNIDDLFRRIPELRNVIEEYLGKPPLCFHIGHSTQNMFNDVKETQEYINKTGNFVLHAPKSSSNQTCIVDIYETSSEVTIEYLQGLALPFYDYFASAENLSDSKFICGKFDYSTKFWHEELNTYSSNYSPTSIIAPLWNRVCDPIVINFTLLYTLSIIVRYLPDLWNEIKSGKLDHYGSLIDYYISIIEHVLPLKMLERITESEISIHQPGSIFGQI